MRILTSRVLIFLIGFMFILLFCMYITYCGFKVSQDRIKQRQHQIEQMYHTKLFPD